MVLHLAEQLDVPLRERNQMLLAAGYAPALRRSARSTIPDMQPVREAIDLVLAGHEPYPALVIDQHWELLAVNRGVAPLLEGVAPHLLEPPVNALRVTLHPEGWRRASRNLAEWRAHLLDRLGRQVAVTGDPALANLHRELSGYPSPPLASRRTRRPGGRDRRLAPARRRRARAVLLQHGHDVRHGGGHHGGGDRHRVVLPGRRRDGRAPARLPLRESTRLHPPATLRRRQSMEAR